MSIRRRKRNPLTRFIAPLATLCLLGYFGFHALNGQHGLRAQVVMNGKIAKLEARLAEKTEQRRTLETRLALLQDGTMERDMVDEQARRQLNVVRKDEILLLHD